MSVTWLPAQPYATADDLLCDCDAVDTDSAVFDWALMTMSRRVCEILGGRYAGIMQSKIRPCRKPCSTLAERIAMDDVLRHPRWPPAVPCLIDASPAPVLVNAWACNCGFDPCTCGKHDAIVLPYRPVVEVIAVMVDGVLFTDWQLVGARLYRTDGKPWPSANDQFLPDTEVGTWSIIFNHGLDLPPDGKPLVAAAACELAKRMCGQGCQLPDGLRVISRPGVEFAVVDWDYRDRNLTGHLALDDWLLAELGGPNRAREKPRMWTQRRHRAARFRPRLESRFWITNDEPSRETLNLWDNNDLDKHVVFTGRTITSGVLTILDADDNEFLTVNATITDGEAFFHVAAADWPPFPEARGRWDMVVHLSDGGTENIAEGPVDFHLGASDA